MKDTIFIGSTKLSDDSFYIDVLFFPHTSFSKSLYPTISRYFKIVGARYEIKGNFSGKEERFEVGKIDGVHSISPYTVLRTTYTRN